jgi:dipeptidyl aminopeptidase/acylaminoacyl peptidase
MDLLWAVRCPVLLLHGDQDGVWVGATAEEAARRMTRAGVDHRIVVYPGGGHAFSSPGGGLYHEPSDTASWRDAIAFVESVTR